MKLKPVFVQLIAFVLMNNIVAYTQMDHIGAAIMPAHPRILLLKGEENKIKKSIANDKVWLRVQQSILTASDKLLPTAPVERIKIGRRLLDKSREALRRIFFLSYAYRLTLDQKYAQRAEKELLAVSTFSDWNPSHFLDVAEMTMGVSIGYDWLYDFLSPASRSTIKLAILEKGIRPSLDSANNGWLTAEHNWNQVCNAGMAYGALAIYEDQPDLCKQVINRSINTVPASMKDFGPDGAYPEGYGYWGYGTSFNVMLISALDKVYGKNFGLSDMPGFLKTAGYLENMTGPSGKPFNYSDAGINGGIQPAVFWFAQKNNDPSLLWVERSRLMKDGPEKFANERLLPAMMIWGAGINLANVQPPTATAWVGRGKTPVALFRSSWTDSAAIFVGIKGGSAGVNHAHMDIGSFVMDADGERWAMDFGMQEYESLESKGMQIFGRTQDAQRWTVFRYVNQAHNTLTINNRHQLVTGYAPLFSSSAAPGFMNAIIDISDLYKGSLSKAVRGIAIVNKQYVVVRDEIAAADTVTTIRWTLVTPASVVITGKNSAVLTQHGKQLVLRVEASREIVMKIWPTDPPPNAYDAPNTGTTSTGFEITVPAKTRIALTVFLLPKKAEITAEKITALQLWKHD